MTASRWTLVLALAAMTATACEPERRKQTEPPAGGEGEGEPRTEDGEEGEGERGGAEQGGVEVGEAPAEGEGEGEPVPAGEGEGEPPPDAGGEGEGDGPQFCRDNSGCPDGAYCDRRTGECIVVDGCDPCDPTDFCAPVGGQPKRCDFRFAAAGCCIDSCISDDDCADDRYCDFGGPSCEPGCRLGECGDGLICGLLDRQCREGCLEQADCPGVGRICDIDHQVCVDGCLEEGGCVDGERCDVELRQCTAGCVADGDCGEGRRCHRADHRCVSACIRDGDCLQGQLCDDETGGCVANPRACLAAGCQGEAACDPIRGICGEAGQLDCQPGAACAAAADAAEGEGEGEGEGEAGGAGDQRGVICVPEGSEERFACASSVGEGGAGDACETGADCTSGICLNDGACYVACGAHGDCPDGMRCWSARFLVGLSEELLDPSGDGVREVPACRTPPTPCATPEACEAAEEECLPWWDPDAEAMTAACRPAAGGELPPGARCHSDDDCVTGVCTRDQICLEICEGDGSCEDGQLCGSVVAAADGRQGEVPACVLDPGSGQVCTRDADCPEGEACHPEAGEGDDEVALRCRPGAGLGPAELCDESWDCLSGHCVNGTYCFAACTGDGDCPEGVPCQEQPSGVRDRQEVLVSMCIEPNLPCVRDSDCPLEGQACAPEEDPDDPEVLAPLCREAQGDRRGGAECRRDRDCLSGYCIQDLQAPVCWEGCSEDDDCDDDMRCYDDVAPVPVADGFDSLPACLPDRGSLEDCDNNDDCGAGEVCSVVVSGDRDRLNTRCVFALTDPSNDQFLCLNPEDCSTGMCAPGGGFLSPCLRLCDGDQDCPQDWQMFGMSCQRVEVEFQGVTDRISFCASAF